MKIAKLVISLLEKLIGLGHTSPVKSIEALDSYGWDKVGDKEYRNSKFPWHKMKIASGFVRHSVHGVGTSVSHDDFPKYLRGVHQNKSAYKDTAHSWNAGEGDDED